MSRQAGKQTGGFTQASIDGGEFAREGRSIGGMVPVAALTRIADSLVDVSGELDCRLRGERDDEGNSYLLLDVAGDLQLRCQRCLEGMKFELRVHSRLLLAPLGAALPEDEVDNDEFDVIEAGSEVELLPLLEDEVVLALPLAPRHERCETPIKADKDCKPSAFAGLAGLKKHR